MTLQIFVTLLCALLGASLGSFANVCVVRWAQGGSISQPKGSQCPKCHTPIPIWRNIPLVSYTLQRGRCVYCSCKIPAKYLVWEILGCAAGTIVGTKLAGIW